MSRRVTIRSDTYILETDLDQTWVVFHQVNDLVFLSGVLEFILYSNDDSRGAKAAMVPVYKCLKEAQQGSDLDLQGLFNILDGEFTEGGE